MARELKGQFAHSVKSFYVKALPLETNPKHMQTAMCTQTFFFFNGMASRGWNQMSIGGNGLKSKPVGAR